MSYTICSITYDNNIINTNVKVGASTVQGLFKDRIDFLKRSTINQISRHHSIMFIDTKGSNSDSIRRALDMNIPNIQSLVVKLSTDNINELVRAFPNKLKR